MGTYNIYVIHSSVIRVCIILTAHFFQCDTLPNDYKGVCRADLDVDVESIVCMYSGGSSCGERRRQ
jgi:hypothetical protein